MIDFRGIPQKLESYYSFQDTTIHCHTLPLFNESALYHINFNEFKGGSSWEKYSSWSEIDCKTDFESSETESHEESQFISSSNEIINSSVYLSLSSNEFLTSNVFLTSNFNSSEYVASSNDNKSFNLQEFIIVSFLVLVLVVICGTIIGSCLRAYCRNKRNYGTSEVKSNCVPLLQN